MTPDEQVELWIAGRPVHNEDRDECCPDFSCCVPELLCDPREREEFKNALDTSNEAKKMGMLSIFLERLILFTGGDGDDIAYAQAVQSGKHKTFHIIQ